ncbi:sigma-70 family RNA polymerase sigma factor [Nakamurella leprariae]|uniref:Sigma-70 family RNA polymerase sigma factor n=1 Tax=Nakamurella leprariae TaxID=2803911 RepID=A0A938Y5S1_9ACTN|nr:sigma-70 family RNA polymerase sigma factor [Nakamurella leprariae]MBM9466546.1 sigma-70 family RNA polymerase sigma factor [Nakamurella leprariae]
MSRPARIASAPSPERAKEMTALLEGLVDCDDPAERRRRRSVVVNEYLPVARSIAARYRGRGVERGDLEQLAALGLVKAVSRWIPGHADDFLQFAVPTISGEIKRYFRDHSWLVRPPRRIQEHRVAIKDVEHQFWQQHGRQPTDTEVARLTELSHEEVSESRSSVAVCRPPSLDADSGPGWVLAQTSGEVDSELEQVENRLAVERLLETLTETERRVVHLRFECGWSQSKIAEEVGVSQMQISRWLRAIARKLRATWN